MAGAAESSLVWISVLRRSRECATAALMRPPGGVHTSGYSTSFLEGIRRVPRVPQTIQLVPPQSTSLAAAYRGVDACCDSGLLFEVQPLEASAMDVGGPPSESRQ